MRTNIELNKDDKILIYKTGSHKKTIIAVHGLTGNHKTFHHFRNLLDGEYNFISYDLRGRGDSSPAKNDTSISSHAQDLKLLIQNLGIENPILMGYSMGAYICAQVASELDAAGLILLDGGGTTEEKQRKLIIPSLSRLNRIYASENEYVSHTKSIYESLNVMWDEVVEDITRYEVKKVNDGWKHKSDSIFMEKDFNSFYEFYPSTIFPEVTCPTLLVIATGKLGMNDSLFSKETYYKTIECAENIKVFETEANHYTLVLNKQHKVEECILRFLKDI